MSTDIKKLISVLIHFKSPKKTGSDLMHIHCNGVKLYTLKSNLVINFLEDDFKGELEKLINEKKTPIGKYADCNVYYIEIPLSEIYSFDVRIDD